MAEERPRPKIDRVREQRRRLEQTPDPDWSPDDGPDPERVTEVSERVEAPTDQPRE